jgi:hypothetical protein
MQDSAEPFGLLWAPFRVSRVTCLKSRSEGWFAVTHFVITSGHVTLGAISLQPSFLNPGRISKNDILAGFSGIMREQVGWRTSADSAGRGRRD